MVPKFSVVYSKERCVRARQFFFFGRGACHLAPTPLTFEFFFLRIPLFPQSKIEHVHMHARWYALKKCTARAGEKGLVNADPHAHPVKIWKLVIFWKISPFQSSRSERCPAQGCAQKCGQNPKIYTWTMSIAISRFWFRTGFCTAFGLGPASKYIWIYCWGTFPQTKMEQLRVRVRGCARENILAKIKNFTRESNSKLYHFSFWFRRDFFDNQSFDTIFRKTWYWNF